MPADPIHPSGDWRHTNIGRRLSNSLRRFEARVLELMAIAGHPPVRHSLIAVTRNLDLDGTRIGDLARRSSMTKQAMGELVWQCEGAGLVTRTVDPDDRRAQRVAFTPRGLVWLRGFQAAVEAAEAEMRRELGENAVNVLASSLDRYGQAFDPLNPPPVG